jgi:hypothetical protein
MPLYYDLGANIPWYARQILSGVEISYSRPQELLPGILIEKGNFGGILPWSHFGCPFRVAGEVAGFIGFDALAQERRWSPRIAQRLRLIAAVFGNAIARKATTTDATGLREELTQVASASPSADSASSAADEPDGLLTPFTSNVNVDQSLLSADVPEFVKTQGF